MNALEDILNWSYNRTYEQRKAPLFESLPICLVMPICLVIAGATMVEVGISVPIMTI